MSEESIDREELDELIAEHIEEWHDRDFATNYSFGKKIGAMQALGRLSDEVNGFE